MLTKKRAKSILLSPFTLGVVITLAFTYLSLDYYGHRVDAFDSDARGIRSLIQEVHEKTIDWRMKTLGHRPGSDRVAILAIDDETLRLEGRWPWPRDKTAKLIDRTMFDGAKSISFDMIFSEPDNNASLPTLARLKTVLDKNPAAPALSTAFEDESSKADLDRIFSRTIQDYQDNLILGAFYLGDLKVAPYSDICINALYERSYPARYWGKEAIQTTVVDTPLQKLGVPRDLSSHLGSYFTALEVSAAQGWLEARPEISPRIQAQLGDVSSALDASLFPGIAALVLNNDFESGKALLEELKPGQASLENVRDLFGRFTRGFTPKELASLTTALRTEDFDYCRKFFSDGDDLMNLQAYEAKWGKSEEAKEQFNTLKWETFFNDQKPKKNSTEEIARLRNQAVRNELPELLRWEVNIPILADATKHTGYFNAFQDSDGSVRRSRLISRHGDSYTSSLALKTFLRDRNYSVQANIDLEDVGRNESSGKVIGSLKTINTDGDESLTIPVDKVGNLMINYSGERRSFPHISATDILSDQPYLDVQQVVKDPENGLWKDTLFKVNKKDFLKDKMLILGVTAVGIYDLRVTPFDENFPGVETHANVLSNLLIEDARARGEVVPAEAPGFLRTHPLEEKVMWLVLLATGLIVAGFLTYLGSVAGLAVTVAVVALFHVVDQYVLFKHGIVVVSLFPVSLTIFEFVGLTSFKYFTEERKKRELKGTFAKYVSPAIVEELLSDPEKIELGGKKMELTVMFSDVRGFTTISEKLDPRALGDLLNSYLTPMTDLVFEHKGTLDKYMGDAIMAFWGAPVHFPDHAKHACRCALAMLVKLRELQAEYRAKGLPEIDIGIGLNTGDMSVGNMGSNTVRSYTVMGDAVNLGSRLEGINKQYGTRIIISEFTYNEVKSTFICREVDWVKVKGKELPVRIFELVGEGQVTSEQSAVLSHFGDGFALYHQMKFQDALEAFGKAQLANADDAPTQLYIERCQDYLKDPPPADWDGVFTMTSK